MGLPASCEPVEGAQAKRVLRPRLFRPKGRAEAFLAPQCPECGTLALALRGRWQCGACGCVPIDMGAALSAPIVLDTALVPLAAPTARVFSASECDNSVSSTGASAFGQWLTDLEGSTSPFRWRRAMHHRLRQRGFDHRDQWHEQRRRSQLERFDKVRQCGAVAWMLDRHAPEGTTSKPMASRCGCWRVCKSCADVRRWRLQKGVELQRVEARKVHARRVWKGYRGPEGRWSERLITLTVPHSGSPAADVEVLKRAWQRLAPLIAAHLQHDRGVEKGVRPVWVRAFEITPSEHGSGHAHMHLWWLGPFIDHAWLRVTFGRILESFGVEVPQKPWDDAMASAVDARSRAWCRTRRGVNGRTQDSVPWPVVDVRSDKSSRGETAKYAAKVGVAFYVVKSEGLASKALVHPLHAAAIYEALEGVRAVQWARGWAPPREEPPPGVTFSRRPLTDAERRALAEQFAQQDHHAAERLAALAEASAARERAAYERAKAESDREKMRDRGAQAQTRLPGV
jgi:ribosomal protein S27AE